MKKADSEHIGKVVALECIACQKIGYYDTPAEFHHLRSGAGLSQRSSHKRGIPLCPTHHRTGGYGVAFHAGQKAWEAKFGSEEDLYAEVMEALNMPI